MDKTKVLVEVFYGDKIPSCDLVEITKLGEDEETGELFVYTQQL